MNKIKNAIKKISMTAAVVGFLGLSAGSAEAALFDFSYTLQSGDVLSGTLDGNLQGDNDTVLVNSIIDSFFKNNTGPALPFVDSITNFFLQSGLPATVSLSGSTMDIIAYTDPQAVDGFLFDTSGIFGYPAYGSGLSYGDTLQPYNPSNWSLTPQISQSVPEPASLLGLFGAGAFGATLKRKKQVG